MNDRSLRTFLHFSTSLVKSAGLLALTFFLTPALLRLIGPENVGTYKVLFELYGYFTIIEFGLYPSLITSLFPLVQTGSKDEVSDLLSEGKRQYIRAMIRSLIVGIIFIPFLPYLVSWKNNSSTDLYVTYGLMLFTLFFMPIQPYKAYLEATNRGHLVNLIVFFQNLLINILGVAFAYFGLKLISQGLSLLIATTLGWLLVYIASNIKIYQLKSAHSHFEKLLKSYQIPQVLNDLALKICLQCDSILISIFLGPVMVVKVFLGQRVVFIVQNQILMMGQAAWASLGALYYSDISLFRLRLLEVTKLLAVTGVAVLVPICILNQSFIRLWVGNTYLMDTNALTFLATANAYMFGIFSFWAHMFSVLGKPRELTGMNWVQALVNFGASLIFINFLGGIGPLTGTLISFLTVPLIVYPSLLKKHFGLSTQSVLRTVLLPASFGVLTIGLYLILPWRISPESWPDFLLWGALILIVNCICLFVIVFDNDEKKMIVRRVHDLIKKLGLLKA